MDARAVARFLLRVFVLLAVLLLAWHKFSVAHVYHSAVAAITDAVYQVAGFGGYVHGVSTDAQDFLIRVLVGGKRTTLHIMASDITSNECTLLALYLASPAGPYRRLYARWFAGSLIGLLLIHVATVIVTAQSAVASHPAYGTPPGPWAARCAKYVLFYEQIGMYLLVLVLWLPYIVVYLRSTAAANREEAKAQRAR
jgi:hypothetical protein